jgi:hypothetical protein
MPKAIHNVENWGTIPDQDYFGAVAWFKGKSITTATGSGDTTREGIDKFTFNIPVVGLYRISVQMTIITAPAGTATSVPIYPILSYTDITGTGAGLLQEGASTGVSLLVGNEKSGGSNYTWVGLHRPLVAPMSIYFNFGAPVGGTKTAGGTVLWSACVERISI